MRVYHLHGFLLLTIQSGKTERTHSLSPLSLSLSCAWVRANRGSIVLDGEAQGRHVPAAVGWSLALVSVLLWCRKAYTRLHWPCVQMHCSQTLVSPWNKTDEAGLMYAFHLGWPNIGRKFIWDQLMPVEFCTEFWSQSSSYYNWHFVLDYISGTSKRERGSSGKQLNLITLISPWQIHFVLLIFETTGPNGNCSGCPKKNDNLPLLTTVITDSFNLLHTFPFFS